MCLSRPKRLAVVRHEGPGGNDLDALLGGPIQVGPVVTVVLGPRLNAVFLVESMNNEEHGHPSAPESLT